MGVLLARSRRSECGCSRATSQQNKSPPAPRMSLELCRPPAADGPCARKMCGGRKTQGREMRQHWENSAFFFFYYCWGFLFFLEGAWERKRLFGADLDGSRPLAGEITRRSPPWHGAPARPRWESSHCRCRGARGLRHQNPPPLEPV